MGTRRHHAKLVGVLQPTIAILKKYVRVFAVGKPRYYLYQGWNHWLAGEQPKAQEAWQKSLAAGESLVMPFEQALAHYEIGRHLPKNDPARKTHLHKAIHLFEQLKAGYHLGCSQAALNETNQ